MPKVLWYPLIATLSPKQLEHRHQIRYNCDLEKNNYQSFVFLTFSVCFLSPNLGID